MHAEIGFGLAQPWTGWAVYGRIDHTPSDSYNGYPVPQKGQKQTLFLRHNNAKVSYWVKSDQGWENCYLSLLFKLNVIFSGCKNLCVPPLSCCGHFKSTFIPAHECFSNWKWYLSASRWSESVKSGGTIDLSGLMDLQHSWDMGPQNKANKSSAGM